VLFEIQHLDKMHCSSLEHFILGINGHWAIAELYHRFQPLLGCFCGLTLNQPKKKSKTVV